MEEENINSKMSIEDYLNAVDYTFEGYTPTEESLEFVNFIKLVEDGDMENKTPLVHMQLLDNIFSQKKKHAILCHRGFAKSTLLTVYLPLYLAVFEKLPKFGTVNYILMVLDSMEGGAKTVRKSLELTYNNSSFLQKYIKDVRFTDAFIELESINGHRLGIKLAGAQQSIRGTRFTNANGSHRPELAIIDDILSDTDAKSPTVIANVENTLHKAVNKAMKPGYNKTIYIGTIFSKSDPLAKVIESGAKWNVNCYPVCEKFPCSREEFKGSWEDRFTYDVVKDMYEEAVAMGRLGDFDGEMMNRVMSEEDRLIQDGDIVRYSRSNVLKSKSKFNFYITTDFATSEKTSSDFSVISVWAYNSNGDWLWVDGVIKRQLMDQNIKDLFRLVQMYKPQSVGIEVTGQQGGFISWIREQMIQKNVFFNLASNPGSSQEGIRPNTNKMVRFNTVVPLFKAKKIWFPDDMDNDPMMIEIMNELSNASASGFKSKHDDFIDTVSMLSVMDPWKPSGEVVEEVKQADDAVWSSDIIDESIGSSYDVE